MWGIEEKMENQGLSEVGGSERCVGSEHDKQSG